MLFLIKKLFGMIEMKILIKFCIFLVFRKISLHFTSLHIVTIKLFIMYKHLQIHSQCICRKSVKQNLCEPFPITSKGFPWIAHGMSRLLSKVWLMN